MRRYKIGKSGDYYKSANHGQVKVLVRDGKDVSQPLSHDSRDFKRHTEKTVTPNLCLTHTEIERRIQNLRIRL